MGIFSRRKNDDKAARAREQESLGSYSGMRVEVLTEGGELLFICKLAIGAGGIAELQQSTQAVQELEGEGPFRVRMRGFDEEQRLAVRFVCDISRLTRSIWRAENIHVVGKDNDRAFFRQDTAIDGEVALIAREKTPATPCKVVNISAGGACIQTSAEYEAGNHLLLVLRLMPDWEATPLPCTICRVTPRKTKVIEYGCSFTDITPVVQDQIVKAIMKLQVRRIKR